MPQKLKCKVKEHRAKHGMTQSQLANKIGVRRETIIMLEKGKCNPSLKLAHDIAKTFGEKIDDLFYFEEETIYHQ